MECSKGGEAEGKRQGREYIVSTTENEWWIMNLLKVCYGELKYTRLLQRVR